jgi:hypothetical protein
MSTVDDINRVLTLVILVLGIIALLLYLWGARRRP